MPIESIVMSALVTAVFAMFGAVLAYGEYQTRHLKRTPDAARTPDASDRPREGDGGWLRAA